jgi:hypothetical protein
MGLSSLDCLCGAYNLIRFGQARELCRSLARHKRKFGSTESLEPGRRIVELAGGDELLVVE